MAKMTLDELVTQLRAAYGDTLKSVVLYGSAAVGEHIAKKSDYNVLVIADDLSTERLRAASAVAKAWNEAGNPAPLTLTSHEWRGSADIFPMEYADIIDRHRVLHGDSPFDGIRVDPKDLRLQLEQEAMGKLLRLRQGVLASGGETSRQIELLAASISPIMIVFRAVLRLRDMKPPASNDALSDEVGRLARFDAQPFIRVVRHVRGEKLRNDEVPAVLAGYVRGMEQLVAYIDAA